MHPNPAFRQTPEETNIAFARERGFGILSVSGQDAPLVSHIPIVIDRDARHVDLHLVRSNPIARALDTAQNAVIAVTGPDSYISPDWYELPDQVPTWNYVAVHLRGTLALRPVEELRSHLDDLSASFEHRLLPKSPWAAAKMSDDALARMMRMIVPARLTLTSIDGTWKLNQNKEDAARESAAKQVSAYGIGHETAILSAMMLGAGEE